MNQQPLHVTSVIVPRIGNVHVLDPAIWKTIVNGDVVVSLFERFG